MACNKQKTIDNITKIFFKDLKDSDKVSKTNKELMDEARANAEIFVEAEFKRAEQEFADEADAQAALPEGVVQELNAAKPKRGNTPVTVTEVNNGKVYVTFPDGKKEYGLDPKEIGLDQKSAEEVIAKYTFGSSANPYFDMDGTAKSTVGLNEELIAIDKNNRESEFDKENSDALTEVHNILQNFVGDINDLNVNISADVSFKTGEDVTAQGQYILLGNTIELKVDDKGPGQEFRNRFSMTNQEAYVHELIHAATAFLFEGGVVVGKDPKTQALIADLKRLYDRARENTTWEDLLPGDARNYSTFEQKQAMAKWNYIFNNDNQVGIHEFTAAIMTNKQFKDALNDIKALDLKEETKNETLLDKIHRNILNFFEKLVGFATNKKNNSITDEGVRLVFDIIKANKKAADKAMMNREVDEDSQIVVDKVQAKVAEGIEVINEKAKKIIEPFVGFADTLDEIVEDKVLTTDELAEVRKLRDEINNIVGDTAAKAGSTKLTTIFNNVMNMISNVIKFLRTMPKIYKLRKLAAGSKESQRVHATYDRLFNKVLETVGMTADGVIRSFLRNFMDKPGIYNWVSDSILRLTKSVDDVREKTYEHIMAESEQWFGDVSINSDRVNIRNNEALTSVVLRTDIQSLGVDVKGLVELLSDSSNVSKKIRELKKQFTSTQLADAYDLANYMVKGVGTPSNARNIMLGFGHDRTPTTAAAIEAMDQLVSYIALERTSPDKKNTLLSFINGENYIDYSNSVTEHFKKLIGFTGKKPLSEAEYKKKVVEGVEGFLISSKGLQTASKEEMQDNPYQQIKGYVKDTYEERRTVEIHKREDKEELEKKGYVYIKDVEDIPGSAGMAMYVTLDEDVKRANGALGLQDMKSRGVSLMDVVHRNSEEAGGWDDLKKVEEFKKLLEKTKKEWRKDRTSVNMSPVYSQSGSIINFRSTLSIAEKEEYLKLETRGTQNLARSRSNMGSAKRTEAHNNEVMEALFADYNENYDKYPEKYIKIKARDLDEEAYDLEAVNTQKDMDKYEKLWARLPRSTKRKAAELFENNEIVINKELLTITFGEDDFSLSTMKAAKRFSPRVRSMLRKTENVWIDLMQIAKNNIVIKTPEVLWGNLVSNAKILGYIGVHPVKGAKLMVTGAKELKRYEKDMKELTKLQRAVQDGVKTNSNRIAELTKELENNTVTPLINAGLYQSIVEDVNTLDDNNRVAKYFSGKLDDVVRNQTLNSTLQLMFMTQKTKPYQQLLKATQMSDFLFRYAQYYDAVNSKGIQPKKAMREVIDNYINYEVPLDRASRYGDKMGPFFFVKYFVRIQKVVKRFVKDHPGRVGIDIGLQHFITGDTPDVLDSSVFDKGFNTYNPFKIFERFLEAIIPSGADLAYQTAKSL